MRGTLPIVLPSGRLRVHPFPVPLAIYDQTLRFFRDAVTQAKLGNADKLAAIRRLDQQCRLAEAAASAGDVPLPSLPALFALERAQAGALGGRTVFDDRAAAAERRPPRRPRQLSLF